MFKHEMKVGMKVRLVGSDGNDHPKAPGVWTIEKINPKTVHVSNEDFRAMTAPHGMVVAAGEAVVADPRIEEKNRLARRAAQGVIIAAVAGSSLEAKGMVGPHVIVGVRGDKAQVVKLGGGSNGRYWSLSTLSTQWEVVTLDELLGLSV